MSSLINTRNIFPFHHLTISVPVFAIFPGTSLKVPCTSVQECDNEEHGIEIRNDASSADDSAPSQTHEPVGDIVGLAAIFPPTASEETIPMRSLNVGWILDDTTRELRERFTELGDALCLHLESALLRHGAIPNIVCC